MSLVRATGTFATEVNGFPEVIHEGAVFDDTDTVVRKYPSCFEPARATHGATVEQATAAPGERRDTRRPR